MKDLHQAPLHTVCNSMMGGGETRKRLLNQTLPGLCYAYFPAFSALKYCQILLKLLTGCFPNGCPLSIPVSSPTGKTKKIFSISPQAGEERNVHSAQPRSCNKLLRGYVHYLT